MVMVCLSLSPLRCVACVCKAKRKARGAAGIEDDAGRRPANYELRRVHACILWYGGGGGGAAAHRRFVPAVGPARRPSILLTN